MGMLKVRFRRGAGTTFHDISSIGILVNPSFVEDITKSARKLDNYHAGVAGIDEVVTDSRSMDGSAFFLIEFSEDDDKFEFLFELLPGESSRLVGVNPRLENKNRIKSLINKVADRKLDSDVRLLI